MADRLIRITTALAVVAVAAVAAVISYRHAYEMVREHGESGATARLVPFTVDGLIWAASMVILDASRRKQSVPALAKWSLGVGIVATIGANVAHGLNHGAVGALVSAWPALALVGSFELLMMLTRSTATSVQVRPASEAVRVVSEEERPEGTEVEQTPEDAVLADYLASLGGPGRPLSQRFLAEKHGVDRRKVREIISTVAQLEPA
jgi:pheromone shutdown protein TraB